MKTHFSFVVFYMIIANFLSNLGKSIKVNGKGMVTSDNKFIISTWSLHELHGVIKNSKADEIKL